MCPQALPWLMHQHLLLENEFLQYSFLPHPSQTVEINKNVSYTMLHVLTDLSSQDIPCNTSLDLLLTSVGLAPK